MKILLVSDDKEFAEQLNEKLIFLRREDGTVISDYANVSANLKDVRIVLIHQNGSDEKTFELIKNLRVNKDLCLIFISNSYDDDIILSAADLGIDDFILSDAKDFEFVIRIVNNIKHLNTKLAARANAKLLENLNVVDKYTQLYGYEYCRQLLENYSCGTFIALTPCDRTAFFEENMANVIKSSLRTGDIAFSGKGANFYVFLPETDLNGAVAVFNKINSETSIRAGISDISNKNFDEYEKDTLTALSEASDGAYVFTEIKENTLDEWLCDVPSGGYKLFRKVFNTKLEKVIAPVFYRLQKSYEEKLFETEIEQYTNSEQCVFTLKNKYGESTLRIVYPGFAKIMIYINHDGLDSPENREISLRLDKITQKELIKIAEDFIEEFKETRCQM